MRLDDDEDPKKPRPVGSMRKGDGYREAQEHGPRAVGPDERRDHHRHVHSC